MKNIKTKNITIPETPETDEAEKLLSKKLQDIKNIKYILLGITLPTAIILNLIALPILATHELATIKVFTVFYLIAVAIIFFIWYYYKIYKNAQLKPFQELLELAISNDKIRHEEKIRYNERKKLEQETKQIITLPKKPQKETKK